ncbi:Alcohol dehydrogenase [[Actinomadura] parvosata subsp. kistnae]|uniref:Zn-dependent alcohol dehydrogenase n=2 Tax=Nonomuraea TaxID=83681 RepID=A0A1V0AFL2_9ACTN|nr:MULTISPECIES: Zn-dependent alcohol dehydrogenase [unclassified Nonomuraea]AQZ68995.1 Zn-dependent alcohol dehydrogenase [Nonomuraea sp. ATCC 55076]NJP90316.1 Zn-dependent alcohol dehydrogenase [Nonomuraea sp. FMUSA5-5]SPL92446.1 Alcohol dehydrogenase [Actinomadura parvosata subsp. kistnae]
MRAAILHAVGNDKLDIRDDVTLAPVGPADVRVRIRATGVCHSDLSAMTGVLPQPVPLILGHEGAGEVVEVGEHVTSVKPGDHVVISWRPACQECELCVGGQPFLCMKYVVESFTKGNFRLGDGSTVFGMAGCGTWAEEIVVPWQGAIKIDDDVSWEAAALIGCGITTGVGAVLNTAKVRPGSTVAVVGCGGVGLSVIQGARVSGARTILAVDPLESKHELARKVGATHAVTPEQVPGALAELTGGAGFDYAFEVVGKSATIQATWQLARQGGDVIVVGAGAMDDTVSISAFSLLFEGKNLLSSLYGEADVRHDFPYFAKLHKSGLLDLESMISARIRLTDLNDAVAALKGGEVLRQIVLMD